MKTMIYYTSNYSPTALIMAARKTGLIHNDRSLLVSDLKQLTFLNSGGIKGKLIFVGADRNYNQIYALTACGPKDLILRFLNSFLGLCAKENKNSENKNHAIIDCTVQPNLLLELSWFLYRKNIFRSIFGQIVCNLINKGFTRLKVEKRIFDF